ncbi:MAG TPA: T9SS type A sorting domain-containing protein [Flavipsychrobacter sp.]|nr:T9SS type A sorting domain-containing protein [Flavipsychrobacter sp.]
MKKLLLLFAAGAVAATANAQQLVNKSASFNSNQKVSTVPSLDETFNFTATPTAGHMKTTLGGSRWYNFVDLLITFGSDPAQNFGRSFMSDKKLVSFFGATAGFDTVFLTSFGSVLDPSTTMFNDPGLVSTIGNQIAIGNSNPYQLDSIRVYGEYQRNPSTPSTVVDTLRVAVVYGYGTNTNLPIYYFTGQQAKFGYDTVRFAEIFHDTVRNIAGKASAGAPNVVVRDIYLDASKVDDTAGAGSNFEGLNMYGVGITGVNIPAGQLVGATVTFISGSSNVPMWDTAMTQTGIKHNHWRAWYFTEKTSAFQTYTPGDWNVGLTKYNDYYDPPGDSWRGFYIPSYAYTSAVWHENPLIDYKLTCPTCPLLSVNDVNASITAVNAYPNPAASDVTITYSLKNTSVATVNVTNAVGQVLASQKASNGKVVFSTANLANGIYFYTVEANGEKVTNRFVVAH